MIDLLYAFGIGLFFSGGIFTGMFIHSKLRQPEEDKWEAHRDSVEHHMKLQVKAINRIADGIING